jgi:hypothetical protein
MDVKERRKELREFLTKNGYIGMRGVFKDDCKECECFLSQVDEDEEGFMHCLDLLEEKTPTAAFYSFFFFAKLIYCEYLRKAGEK